MRNFKVSIESLSTSVDNSGPAYRVSIRPFSHRIGGTGSKDYTSPETLAEDLKRYFRFSSDSVRGVISCLNRGRAEIDYFPLSDEDALFFGWIPDHSRCGYRASRSLASARSTRSAVLDAEPDPDMIAECG